jgi:propanediol dehydratase small subunit
MSILAILVLLALAWSVLSFGQIGNPFRTRTSQGRLWRRAFPWASKRQIRDFLAVFAEAFSFRDTEKLKFRPDDQLLGIYKTLHPAKWMAGAAEIQKLSTGLRARYGVTLDEVWDDQITLGALFAHVQGRNATAGK